MSNNGITRKASLTSQSTQGFIVIRKFVKIPFEKIQSYCEMYFKRWAFIEHEGDISPNTGETEGVHYHIIGDFFAKPKTRFSTRLNQIADFFGFDNTHGIQIDAYRTFEGALQYLTHKNFPNKTRHKVSEIHHNLKEEDFHIYYNADIGQPISFDLIYSVCSNHTRICDIIQELGITNYRIWRPVIRDINDEIREERERERLKELKEKGKLSNIVD